MPGELFVPKNLLENCQGLQELIAITPPEEKDTAGADAKAMIGPDDVHYYGATKLEIRTLAAYGLPDNLTVEAEIWPVVEYGELRVKGKLGQVSYMRLGRLASLAWMIVDPIIRNDYGQQMIGEAEVAGVSDDVPPTNISLRRPLYLPVGMIESVMIAA